MKEDRLAKLQAMKEKNKKLREQLDLAPVINTNYSTNSSVKKQSLNSLEEQQPSPAIPEKKPAIPTFSGSLRKYKKESLSVSSLDEIVISGFYKESISDETQCDEQICHYFNSDNEQKNAPKVVSRYSKSKDKDKLDSRISFNPNVTEFLDKKEKAEEMKAFNKLLNDDFKKQTLITDELTNFLNTKTKLIENTLHDKQIYDIFKCYYDDEGENDLNSLNNQNLISNFCEYYDESLCSKRSVSNLEYSQKQIESLLSVYSKSEDSNLNDPHGLILLWNMNKKKHEYSIICQTEITSAIFHKHNPKLIIGATYTGQIMIWDTRGKSVPVQKTPPGGKFHSHPIYCLGMTGSLTSNSIISISNDGVLCTWSMGNLSKNSKQIYLRAKKKKNTDTIDTGSNQYMEEIGAICMATSENEPNNLFIGTDESDIYQVYTNQSNSENPDNISEVFRKHNAPITGLDLHPGDIYKNANLDHLFLSSSMDWTINLWSKNFDSPLITLDLIDDYVYDLKWHPTNPSLFVSGDGGGKLDLWDLNRDPEAPIFRHEVGKEAINKLAWSADGKKLSLGDINGKIHIFNIEKDLTEHKPDDAFKMEKTFLHKKIATERKLNY